MSDDPFMALDEYIAKYPNPQSGPCVVCGATNYSLSMGGPGICPWCDTGASANPRRNRERISALEAQVAALQASRDALQQPPKNPEWHTVSTREKQLAARIDELVAEVASLRSEADRWMGRADTYDYDRQKLSQQLEAARSARRELLLEVWHQFALDSDNPDHPYFFDGKWPGGLSTLENIALELRELSEVGEAQT